MPRGIPGRITITCMGCGQEKEHCAKGMCKSCWSRCYYQEHRDEIVARRCHHYQSHREEYKARDRRWQQGNPEKVVAKSARRRARKAQVANTLTQEQIDFETNIARAMWPDEKLHLHHIVSMGKGGNHSWGNIMVIPASLNQSIGDKLPQEVYQQKELF